MSRHYTPAEIKQHIREQAALHKSEAVRKASDEVVPQLYASVALAIMQDPEDTRTDEDKADYIQRIFDRSAGIWAEAASIPKKRAYRVILDQLYKDYGIEIKGFEYWEAE